MASYYAVYDEYETIWDEENKLHYVWNNRNQTLTVDSLFGNSGTELQLGKGDIALGIIGFVLAIVGWIYVIHYESKMEIK